jgi:hypothetical protein
MQGMITYLISVTSAMNYLMPQRYYCTVSQVVTQEQLAD